MAKLSTLQFLGGLVLASSAATVCLAPACTVSSGSGGNDAGAGGDGNQGGSGASTTGGTTSTGGSAGSPAGGGGGDSGGTTGDAGAGGSSGDSPGGAAGEAGAGGAGGAGGASGKVCTNPTTAEMSAKGDTCDVYCAAYLSTCATFNTSDGTFTNLADCLTTCEFFDDAQLCCRAYHVRNAAGTAANAATTHCPHAGGDGVVCN